MGTSVIATPQEAPHCTETRYTTYRSLRSVHSFSHNFYLTPKILCIAMLFNRLDTPKVSFSVGTSALPSKMVPLTHPTQHPKLHRDWFSRFCTAHCRDLYFTLSRPLSPDDCPFVWGIWTSI